MKKFAFINQNEKTALLEVVKQQTPPEFYKAFAKFAAGTERINESDWYTFQPPPQKSSAVEERLGQLREMFHDFMGQVGLGENAATMQWVEKVIQALRPTLEKMLKNTPDLASQLSNVPSVQKNQPNQDITRPSDIEDFPKAKPTVVPQNMKLSPGKQNSNLFRSQSTAWQLKEGAMEKDAYDKLTDSLLELADLADEAGLIKQADKMAAVLPAIRTLKVAQYEGFQNYWIANGRAFEMAYKKKRMKGKTDPEKFRSAQDVWFEVLQEYQDSLLTNQGDFISKYAGKKYSRDDKAASGILMKAITSRIENGASPGVAFYESVRDLPDGEHQGQVSQDMNEAIESIANAAKETGNEKLAIKAEGILKEAGFFGNLWNWVRGREWGGTAEDIAKGFDSLKSGTLTKLYNLEASAKAGGPIDRANFFQTMAPVQSALMQLSRRARASGMDWIANMPDQNSILDASGNVDPIKLPLYVAKVEQIFSALTPDVIKDIDKHYYKRFEGGMGGYVPDQPEHQQQPPPQAKITPEKGIEAIRDFIRTTPAKSMTPKDKTDLAALLSTLSTEYAAWLVAP